MPVEYFSSLSHIAPHDVMEFILKALGGFVVLAASYLTGIILSRIINKLGDKQDDGSGAYRLLSGSIKGTCIILGVVSALGTIGVDVRALVAGLGLTGFALGFALKDILSNVVSGFLILIYRPIKLGQKVTISGYTGVVNKIDVRYTTLTLVNEDNSTKEVIIPNSKIFQEIVTVG